MACSSSVRMVLEEAEEEKDNDGVKRDDDVVGDNAATSTSMSPGLLSPCAPLRRSW